MHSPAVQKRSARITSECDKNIPRKPSRMHVVQCVAMCRELSKVTVDEHDDFLFDCSGSAGRGFSFLLSFFLCLLFWLYKISSNNVPMLQVVKLALFLPVRSKSIVALLFLALIPLLLCFALFLVFKKGQLPFEISLFSPPFFSPWNYLSNISFTDFLLPHSLSVDDHQIKEIDLSTRPRMRWHVTILCSLRCDEKKRDDTKSLINSFLMNFPFTEKAEKKKMKRQIVISTHRWSAPSREIRTLFDVFHKLLFSFFIYHTFFVSEQESGFNHTMKFSSSSCRCNNAHSRMMMMMNIRISHLMTHGWERSILTRKKSSWDTWNVHSFPEYLPLYSVLDRR